MQVLAPIAACWSAGQAVADPLAVAICHSVSEQGDPSGRTDAPIAHSGACALCCLAQASASLDSPPQLALAIPYRDAEHVVWHAVDGPNAFGHKGSNAQARAPPHFS